jgi:hypothetical protein
VAIFLYFIDNHGRITRKKTKRSVASLEKKGDRYLPK